MELPLLALQYLTEGHRTIKEIYQMFSINNVTFLQWRALYQFGGSEALTRSSQNKVYPEDLKKATVTEYPSGTHSIFDIVAKYGCGLSVFKNWLKFYTSEKEGLKKVNKKRIYRLMQICGLAAVILRCPKKYRKVKVGYVAENVLALKRSKPTASIIINTWSNY